MATTLVSEVLDVVSKILTALFKCSTNTDLFAGEVGVNGAEATVEEDGLRDLSRFGGNNGGTSGGGGCGRRFRPSNTIMEILEEDAYLSRTMELIEHVGFRPMMQASGSLTLFAPKDIAFDAPRNLVNRLYQPAYLMHAQQIIKYHILDDRVCGLELGLDQDFHAANGESFKASGASGFYTLNPTSSGNGVGRPVRVIEADELASNGVVHSVDSLLLPRWVFQEILDLLEQIFAYSTMNELVVAASMEDVFSNDSGRLTLFAPTDEAFAELGGSLVDCLLLDPDMATTVVRSHAVDGLHSSLTLSNRFSVYNTLQIGVSISVTPGSSLTVNENAEVIDLDRLAFSGILHGIDTVLLPENFVCGFDQDSVAGTILGVLEERGFTALAKMVKDAGLTGFFSRRSVSLTLFAPDNDAFNELSSETLSCLKTNPRALESLLKYHTLADPYETKDLQIVELVRTEDNGRPMLINGLTASDGLAQVNDAGVTEGDIVTTNGIIHKISGVIHATGALCM